MADFNDIIQEINTNLPDNNTQAITAAKLRTTLVDLTNTIEQQQDSFENDASYTINNELNQLDIKAQTILEDTVDLVIGDEDGNALVEFENGNIKTKNFDSSNVLEDTPLVSYDLAIGDENGNAIVEFSNGNIKTKNFDSSSFINDNKFAGKKIAIIGDSISTYQGWLPSDVSGYSYDTYATFYPRGNVNNVSKTWWHKLCLKLGLNPATDISNCAWSGSRVTGDSSSTTNAYASCSTRRIQDLSLRFNGQAPDIVICYISINDWNNNIPLGNWQISDTLPSEGDIQEVRAAYAIMLNKIHTTYPNARIFACTILDTAYDYHTGWPPDNTGGTSVGQFNQAIVEVAEAFGCDIIYLSNCGITYANIANYTVDSYTHPNDAGMTLMANKIYTELQAKY